MLKVVDGITVLECIKNVVTYQLHIWMVQYMHAAVLTVT